jgi:hypothetical protein
MARSKNPIFAATKGVTGAIGKQIVFRNRGDKTFVSKYPDMSNVVFTEEQLKSNDVFGDAVRFAQDVIRDPVKKAAYKRKKGSTVYHTAITDYMRLHRR